jgi:hypothetical protein
MSHLEFSRGGSKLQLVSGNNAVIGTWDAANNVDSRCAGIWPNGTNTFAYYVAHPGDTPNSAFGSHGIFIFNVPGREGMGVHSGREGVPDGLGRSGFLHCTIGCIRTTDEATAQLVRTHAVDPINSITVGN